MRTFKQMSDLSGRVALVTGGAGHIALAAEEALVELGAGLAILDVHEEACEQRADALRKAGASKVLALPCDLEDEENTRAVVRRVRESCGRLDIIVHTAAYTGGTKKAGWHVSFDQQGSQAFLGAFRVASLAAFVLIQEARDALAASGHGSVGLITSIYVMVGPDMCLYEGTAMTNSARYGSSKGGVLQLTRYLATVLAPEIRVNAVSPGGVLRGQPEVFRERYEARTPLGRMAAEEDVKGAIAYLASDLSAYVTGHNLVVDGGWTAW